MADLSFDQTLGVLERWGGKRARVQVVGGDGPVAHIEGELQPRKPPEAEGLAIFELSSDETGGIRLWKEHVTRTLWVNNAQTVLGIQTQGVMASVGLETAGSAA